MNENKYFDTGFIARLSNNEFPQLIHEVMALLAKQTFVTPDLTKAWDTLKQQEENVMKIVNYNGYHHFTAEIDRIAKARKKQLSYLRSEVDQKQKSIDPADQKAAMVLGHWIRPHRKRFHPYSIKPHNRIVHMLQHTRLNNTEIETALEQLHLTTVINQLMEMTLNIEEKVRQRDHSVNSRKIDTSALRSQILHDFKKMLLLLSHAAGLQYPESENYRICCRNIKSLMHPYKTNIMTRTKWGRRKA